VIAARVLKSIGEDTEAIRVEKAVRPPLVVRGLRECPNGRPAPQRIGADRLKRIAEDVPDEARLEEPLLFPADAPLSVQRGADRALRADGGVGAEGNVG